MQRQKAKSDEWYTPAYAIYPVLEYLKPRSIIWCPFDLEKSNYKKVLSEAGHSVICTHIENGGDFFNISVPDCDYIISNPPYSKKDAVLERLIEIRKPFAMLMNTSGLYDSKKRFELLKDFPIELLYLYPRVDFFKDEEGERTSPPYQSAYVCKGVLPNQIIAKKINK